MEINSHENNGQLEITVKLSNEEFKPYILEGARRIASEIKLPGFRPGKAPYAVVKAKVGETVTFIKEFNLEELPENANITVTGDNSYILYVNGKKTGERAGKS